MSCALWVGYRWHLCLQELPTFLPETRPMRLTVTMTELVVGSNNKQKMKKKQKKELSWLLCYPLPILAATFFFLALVSLWIFTAMSR